ERAISENIIADVVDQILLLGSGHRDALDSNDLVDDTPDFVPRACTVELRELRQIDRLDQSAKDNAFGGVIAIATLGLKRNARGCGTVLIGRNAGLCPGSSRWVGGQVIAARARDYTLAKHSKPLTGIVVWRRSMLLYRPRVAKAAGTAGKQSRPSP